MNHLATKQRDILVSYLTKQLETLVISLLQDPQDFKRVTKHKPNGVNSFFLIKDKLTIQGLFFLNKDEIVVSHIKLKD